MNKNIKRLLSVVAIIVTAVMIAGIFIPFTTSRVLAAADVDSIFKVPYISTYYFNAKPTTNDNITIPLYMTDYEQSEYLNNNTSGRLDLIYEVDGRSNTITGIPLGDYTLTIGKLSEGMHQIAVQASDPATGLKSHKLYNDLWVVNPSKYNITSSQIYTVTKADLTKYGIRNDNSTNSDDMNKTRDGLTKLFADLQAKGYRKCILPNGTYRINGEKCRKSCIMIPSYFTVDMNGSTFKLNTISSANEGCIVAMDNAVDAHLINGTLEGDRFERQALKLESACQGEPINTIILHSGKYCSISDLTIKNTTGHTILTNCTWDGPSQALSGFTRTAIINGQEVAAENASTSSMVDLTRFIQYDADEDYMYVGFHSGYRGIKGDSGVIYVTFFNANKGFMETVTGFQYRKIQIPAGAKYARVTLAGSDFPSEKNDIGIYAMHTPEYIEFKNLDFYDTRTTDFAPTACNNVLIDGCTYTRCGNSITPSSVDFEDGWEECQDIYYRNNTVFQNAEYTTATVIDNTGLNHVYENCKGHFIVVRSRLYGGVIKNCNDANTAVYWNLGVKKTNGYGRIYDNDCGYINVMDVSETGTDFVDFKVKNCTIRNSTNTTTHLRGVLDKVVYENCIFPSFAGNNATFVNCTIQPASHIRDNLHFYDCTFKRIDGSSEPIFFEISNLENANRFFENCRFEGKTQTNAHLRSATFRNCVFDDLEFKASESGEPEKFLFENCKISSSAENFLTTGPFAGTNDKLNVEFKNCEITHTGNNLIYLLARPLKDSTILFDNCKINKTGGVIATGYNGYGYGDIANDVSLNIVFRNTTIDKSVAGIDTKNLNPDLIHIVNDNGTQPTPTAKPTVKPTAKPTATPKPTAAPSRKPTVTPTAKVTATATPTAGVMKMTEDDEEETSYPADKSPSAPTPSPTEVPSVGDFVERLYTVALDRESEPEGKDYWVNEIESGNVTGGDCAYFFLIDSAEFRNRGLNEDEFIEALYKTFFGRDSEKDGKAYWISELEKGVKTRNDVINCFIDSTEWCNICADYGVKSGALTAKADHASVKSIEFATRLYTCCLNREADEEGVAYWALALTNLEKTGCSAAGEFFASQEFINMKVSDAEYIRRLYMTFFGREPEDDGIAYWKNEMKKGAQSRENVMFCFGQSDEFIAICKEYGIDRGEFLK